MDLNSWEVVAKMKSRLLGLVDGLLNDEIYTKEEAAFELIMEIETLNGLEETIINQVRNTDMRELAKRVNEIKAARDKK